MKSYYYFILCSFVLIIVISGAGNEHQNIIAKKNNYDQDCLLQLYKIDTMLVASKGPWNNYTEIYLMDNKGKRMSSKRIIGDTILGTTSYNSYGKKLETIEFEHCKETNSFILSDNDIYTYKDSLLLKRENKGQCTIFDTSDEYDYDAKGRLSEYRFYSFGHIGFMDVYEYKEGMTVETRLNEDSTVSMYSDIELDELGRKSRATHYSYHAGYRTLSSIFTYQYDKYGNMTKEKGNFYPGGEVRHKNFFFYSAPKKIDSTLHFSYHDDVLWEDSKSFYEYDDRNFLIKETHISIRNETTRTKTYTYK